MRTTYMRVNAIKSLEPLGVGAACAVVLAPGLQTIHPVADLTFTMMARFCPFSSKFTSLIPSSSTCIRCWLF